MDQILTDYVLRLPFTSVSTGKKKLSAILHIIVMVNKLVVTKLSSM